jgi:subtilisin family serine protease
MSHRRITAIVVLAVGLLAPRGASGAAATTSPGLDEPTQRYIVELAAPPLAQYRGGLPGLPATAVEATAAAGPTDAGRQSVHLDTTTPAAQAYRVHLRRRQERAIDAIRSLAPAARIDWRYTDIFNGFTAHLTTAQAGQVRRLPGVRSVLIEEHFQPEMDSTTQLLNAAAAWEMAGGPEEAGLGARIAVIDSGMDSNHPFLNDAGMPPPPAGFPAATLHLANGTVLDYPAGVYTNNKVIAARIFASPSYGGDPATLINSLTPVNGTGGNSHGLHVSGTAAGRSGTYTHQRSGQAVETRLSGIAPMATLLNYKSQYAGSPEYIAMLEQMVADEVDVLNMSQGHVGYLVDRPEHHPLTRAFEAAADAGIVVVFSSGNAGRNGLTSLSGAFKYSEKVLAVGNTSADGTYDVQVDLQGTGAPRPSLVAAPRGQRAITQTVSGDLVLLPSGGCEAVTGLSRRIAVVNRSQGSCTYAQRATNANNGGAAAMVTVYADRWDGQLGDVLGSSSEPMLPLTSVALGINGGRELLSWLEGNPTQRRATIRAGIHRGRAARADVLLASSSRGPGLDWQLKPDISAPGQNVLSSYNGGASASPDRTYVLMSGTSMSAPHVTGAAALVRSVHPEWTSAAVRSALITTSKRVAKVGELETSSRDATAVEAGPGRLDLTHLLDPGAIVQPPKASFGEVPAGAKRQLTFELASVSPDTATWTLAAGGTDGQSPVTVSPASVTLEPGQTVTFTAELDTAGLTVTDPWGDISVRREGHDQALRVAYYAHIDRPEVHKDVLLVNWMWGATPDRSQAYLDALEALGLSTDVWTIDEDTRVVTNRQVHPPFETLTRHDLVILNTNESWQPFYPLAGAFQYQNYLLHGGNLLLAGQGSAQSYWWWVPATTYADTPGNRAACGEFFPRCQSALFSQNLGCDLCLARHFAGFQFGITATLSGRVLTFPERADEPEMEVILAPHAEADGPFRYPLDLSTGARAHDDAAGNQFRFASGGLLGDPDPEWEAYGAIGNYEDRIPLVRPLWAYGDRVVGTYLAGRQNAKSNIAWNAMFWGFGLEGVGANDQGAPGRERLLGDTFNFLAHNLYAELGTTSATTRDTRIHLVLPARADVPTVTAAEVDWGDGGAVETIRPAEGVGGDVWEAGHRYAEPGTVHISLKLTLQGMAPLYVEGDVDVTPPPAPPAIYLPMTMRDHIHTEPAALRQRAEAN